MSAIGPPPARTAGMRSLLLLSLLPVVALAELPRGEASGKKDDSCTIEAGPRDVVKRTGDVIVTAGQDLEQVIALRGSVTVLKGAKVRTIIAVRGDAIVQGVVEQAAIAVGGKVKLAPGGVIKGGRVELAESDLSLTGKDGEVLKGDLSLDNQSLSQLLYRGLLEKVDACRVKD